MQPSSPTRRSAALRALPAHPSHGFAKAPLALAAQVLIAASSIAMLGWAPQATAQTAPQSTAPAVRAYSIPAGPLSTVLTRLSVEGGLRLAGASAEAQGVQSPGVQGRHSASSALAAALAGTNVEAVPQGDGSYLLRQIGTLPEVTVTAPEGRGDVATLPEVVVTASPSGITEGTGSFTTDSTSAATGMNLSLRETPQSISIISRERMDKQQLNNISDALDQTVGVTVVRAGPSVGGEATIFSRGYQIQNYQVNGLSTPFQVFGYRHYIGASSLDTALYDSVTVVRGATGLMTGAGDPSGSVNLTRKRPTSSFQASLEGGLGRWDQRRTVADIAGPLNSSGTLRGRLVGSYNESESWFARYAGKNSILYGTLEADISDQTLLTIALEHNRQKSNAADAGYGWGRLFTDGTPTPFTRNDSSFPEWGSYDNTRSTFSATLEHSFSQDWSAKLAYDFSKTGVKLKRGLNSSGVSPDYTISQFRMMKQETKRDINSIGLTINGRYNLFGRRHDLIFGLNNVDMGGGNKEFRFARTTGSVIDGAPAIPEPNWNNVSSTPSDSKTKQSGAYAATRLHATDNLSVIIGGRWSNWDYDYQEEGYFDKRKYSGEFTSYAGIVYNINNNLSAYASYTEIFNPQTDKDINGRLLDPETGKNYEIGLKSEWFEGRLNTSAAIFESRKDNLAVEDTGNYTPEGDQAYLGKNNTKSKGWELEVTGEVTPRWSIQAGYSRALRRDNDGVRINGNLPVHQAKLFTIYSPQSIPGMTIGGGFNWQSEIFEESGPIRFEQKNYAIANLMASYDISKNFNVIVNLNNVFDKSYRTIPRNHEFGPGRNFSASVKYRF